LAKYCPRIPPFLLLPPKATLTLSGKASDLLNPSPPPTLLPPPLVPPSAPGPFPLPLPQMMQSPGRSRVRTGQLRSFPYQVEGWDGAYIGGSVKGLYAHTLSGEPKRRNLRLFISSRPRLL
jgi:hypothetical protein